MGNGGNHAALSGAHLSGENHERRVVGGFEIFGRSFFLERGSKRPPPFPEFYCVVHLGIHFRIARIGKDGAATQRARAEFHPSLKPAEDFSVTQKLRSGGGRVAQLGVANLVSEERFLYG